MKQFQFIKWVINHIHLHKLLFQLHF
jgi:hypothetical protein